MGDERAQGREEPGQTMTEPAEKDARTWAVFCHLASFSGYIVPFGSIVGPIIVWCIKKDEYPFVDDQGKESINFQLSLVIYALALCLTCVGILLLPAVVIAQIVLPIVAAVKASEGVPFRYPLTIRMIK